MEFNLKEHWDTGYNANVKITNTSDETIENWALGFNFSGEISNIWNAKIVEALNDKEAGKDDANENNTSDLNPIVIKNDVWNQDILPESSVEFGFSGSGGFNGFPTKYHILGEKRLADPEDYYVEYSLSSDWGSGFNSSIMISNVSDKDIEDWILEFDFEREITNIWNGTIPSCKEGHYVIKNSGYNSIIYSKHNIQFGFSGCNGDANIVPTDYKLYYYDLTKEKSDNEEQKHSETSSFQGDNNSNPVENEKEEINTENNQEEKHSDDAKSIDNGQHDDPDKEEQNNPIEEIDKTKDTDNDGLFDYIEFQIGTDIEKADTDGDGLSDYYEIMSMSYDPTKMDTDNNGINDGEEDLDNDGLTNLKELEINIDPSYPDSDEDGLKDGEEINTYNTDPCKYDTDGDKVSDGKEIELGTDPLTYNEKFEVTVMSEDEDTVKASVKISLTGKQVNTLSVNRFNNDFLFPEDMPGYIGGAYDFKVEGEFDQATLCFEFDEALLDEENFDPVIYYFNEEEQWLYELDTTVEENTAIAVTTHFSKYILINRMAFKNVFFDYWSQPENVPMKLVMVIDDSGTLGGRFSYDKEKEVFLGGTDPEHKRLKIAKNIVKGAEDEAVLNIIKADNNFDRTYAKDYRDLTICDEKGKKWLLDELDNTNFEWCIDNPYWTLRWSANKKSFDSCGGKNLYYICLGAVENFLSASDDPTLNKDYAKVIVIISDGKVDDYDDTFEAEGKGYAYIKKLANQMGVQIVTIGLGGDEDSFNKYLKPLSTATNGKFYYAKDLENVDNIYEYIKKDLGRDIEIDSDSDGIPDAYEDGLLLFNGKRIKLDKNNPDTDGDGLLDGQEVELEKRYYVDTTKAMVIGGFKSNPLNPDSDGDGEDDATDPTPFVPWINEEICKKICELDWLAKEFRNNYVDLKTERIIKEGHVREEYYDIWFTFMFIRQFNANYNTEKWEKVAGAIDYRFIEYIKNNNPDLYYFFEMNTEYFAEMPKENIEKKGDLYHLAATMSALLYESNFKNGKFYGIMEEKHIDALAGWAGDLQTAMNDAVLAVGKNADYLTYSEAMGILIACDIGDEVYDEYPNLKALREEGKDIHFREDDMYADVDAVNLYENIIRESITVALYDYFRSGFKTRYGQFIDGLGTNYGISPCDIVYIYTNEYYSLYTNVHGKIYGKKIDFSTKWPLLNDKVDFNENISIAAGDVFVYYISERAGKELANEY